MLHRLVSMRQLQLSSRRPVDGPDTLVAFTASLDYEVEDGSGEAWLHAGDNTAAFWTLIMLIGARGASWTGSVRLHGLIVRTPKTIDAPAEVSIRARRGPAADLVLPHSGREREEFESWSLHRRSYVLRTMNDEQLLFWQWVEPRLVDLLGRSDVFLEKRGTSILIYSCRRPSRDRVARMLEISELFTKHGAKLGAAVSTA